MRRLGHEFRNEFQPSDFLDVGTGEVLVLDRTTGERIDSLTLPEAPIEHGLAAAAGHLYVTLKDGRLVCLGE